MTEDEAKTKNCPLFGAATLIAMAQLAGESGVDAAVPAFDAGRKCEGSDCMMWRWDVVPEEVDGGKNWDGHCGLAGYPMPLLRTFTPTAVPRPIGKGVYSNPQPGDPDYGK